VEDKAKLISNLAKIHTTELGQKRLKKNLHLTIDDAVNWCVQKIKDASSIISRKGKNWYITAGNCIITVNARSYTIITAHQVKQG
jgi:hypothetical protein